jgi:hypothetical protein
MPTMDGMFYQVAAYPRFSYSFFPVILKKRGHINFIYYKLCCLGQIKKKPPYCYTEEQRCCLAELGKSQKSSI